MRQQKAQQQKPANITTTKKPAPSKKIIKKLTIAKQNIYLENISCDLTISSEKFNTLQKQSQLERKLKIKMFCKELNNLPDKFDNCKIEFYIAIDFFADDDSEKKVGGITLDLIGEFAFKNGNNISHEEIEKIIKTYCAQQIYDYAKNEFLQLSKKEKLAFKALPDRNYLNIYRRSAVKQSITQIDKLKNIKFKEAMKVAQKAFRLAYQLKDNNLQTKLKSKISATIFNLARWEPELALRYAAYWGEYDLLQDIKNVKDINASADSGNTALHLVIKSKVNDENKVKIVRWLMGNGADPNLKNQENKRPKDYLASTHEDYRSLYEALDQNIETRQSLIPGNT